MNAITSQERLTVKLPPNEAFAAAFGCFFHPNAHSLLRDPAWLPSGLATIFDGRLK